MNKRKRNFYANNHDPSVSLVIPAFNEEKNISELYLHLKAVLEKTKEKYELLFVDDGSSDATIDEVKRLHEQDPCVKLIILSRNFGKQKALKAGIDHCKGNCVICIDADLQHPPELIPQMLDKWHDGYDVVYTIRKEIEGTGFLGKMTSRVFHWFFNKISGIDTKEGSDFNLMDRKVIEQLKNMNESFLFFRGLVSWVGFKQIGIDYVAAPRYSGTTKFSFKKLISLAWDGITSFTILPLRLAMSVGTIVSSIAFIYAVYAITIKVFTNKAVPGWASLLVSVLFIGGIQLICIGILGEYLGKMFIESKRRPVYIVKDKLL